MSKSASQVNFHQKIRSFLTGEKKISLFETPISLSENQILPIWDQENITCMVLIRPYIDFNFV